MRLNTALIARNLAHVLRRGSPDLESHACEHHQLCPPEDCDGRAALYPPGALERIRGLSPWRDWPTERALIEGAPVRHASSDAFVIRDVVLAGGYLYRGRAKARVGQGRARMFDPALPPRAHLPEASVVATWTGADFFGNFMQDSLPLEMLASGGRGLGAPHQSYAHAPGYRALLGMAAPEMPGNVRVDRLTIFRDFAQNSLKSNRYHSLRARLRSQITATPPRGIFVRRGEDGAPRRLTNEAALVDFLAGRGFDILDPARMDATELARRALDSPIVIAVEGSHLAHAIYALADRGAFLVIQPPDRFAMPYKEFADCMQMTFGFVVGRPDAAGFSVDLDEIRLMLDALS